MPSDATTVEAYLSVLPSDRREALGTVRRTILDNLPEGYEEVLNWGMITYQVPLERSGPTYNGKPLMYAALADQKRHMAVYLTQVYADTETFERFRTDYLATGKKLDMGKSCVPFRRLDDLPLDVLGRAIGATGVDTFVAAAQEERRA